MPTKPFPRMVPGGGANPASAISYPPFADGSAQFDGGLGALSLAGGLPFLPANAFSVAWWARQDIAGAADNEFVWGQLADESGTAGDQVRFAFENALGVYRDLMWASDGSVSSNGDAGSLFQVWKMIAVVYDPSTFPPNPTMRQSVNDLPFSVNTSATALMRAATASTSFFVGNGPASAGWSFFRGRIDAMAIYSGALSIGEVTTLWNGGSGFNLPKQVPAGSISKPLLAWYPFDEPSGSVIWRDASGNGRHLFATGTVNSGGPRNT